MRVFVQVILISCLFNTQTTEGQKNKKTAYLTFIEFTVIHFEQNQACLEHSGGTQYHDLFTNECQPCESLENSHQRHALCPEYQLKKTNTELEKADTELDKKLEKSNTELEKADKELELMELETRKQVASSNTLAIVAIFLAIVAIVLLTVIIAFVVRYYSRTLRSQDAKHNSIEESVKLLERNGEPSTDKTSFLIANEESSTGPYPIPKLSDIRGWNDDKIRNFFQKIQHSSSKIEEMEIYMKPQLEHVSDVVATFPHFTRKLKLVLRGGVDDERRRFCTKLQKEIINFDTSKLQTQELKVEVRYSFPITTLLEVVLRRGEPLQFTKLDIRRWNDDEIRKLFQTIQHSSSKIEEMRILMNPQLEDVSDVVATFPHFTRKLELVLYGEDVGRRRRFCRKLMEEIINFDTSKLQTQELKVEVRYTTNLVEVVLRRWKPPQFTRFDIRGWNDDEIRNLLQTIQHSSSKIEEMKILMNPPQLEYVSDHVVATFPHFTRKLKLDLDGGYDERQRFCTKLQKEMINFDTSKVQTEELKVEVRHLSRTLLEVVLRPGKPPYFIKFSTYGLNDDEIRKLFQIIQHPSTKIEEMWIAIKPQLEHVSHVVATFPFLTRRMLNLGFDGYGDDDERREFCRKLQKEIINFETSKLQTKELKVSVWDGNSTTTLLEVVLRRGQPPHFIKFDIRGWNDDEIRKLFQTIQHSSSKIEEMLITMNSQLEHVSDVVATFPHLTRELKLDLRGNYDVNERQFCRKLTEEIINFDNSKLQTQELKVDVRNYNRAGNFLLEVVLRRGKPPQFTKFGIVGWNDVEIRILFQTIQHSSSKIEEMEIGMNPQQLDHVSDVVATFPLLTKSLLLVLVDGGDDERRRFCIKLTEEISNFETSKLQTEELKVEVLYASSSNVLLCRCLLEVVLRREEPPHFLQEYFKF